MFVNPSSIVRLTRGYPNPFILVAPNDTKLTLLDGTRDVHQACPTHPLVVHIITFLFFQVFVSSFGSGGDDPLDQDRISHDEPTCTYSVFVSDYKTTCELVRMRTTAAEEEQETVHHLGGSF